MKRRNKWVKVPAHIVLTLGPATAPVHLQFVDFLLDFFNSDAQNIPSLSSSLSSQQEKEHHVRLVLQSFASPSFSCSLPQNVMLCYLLITLDIMSVWQQPSSVVTDVVYVTQY